MGGSSYGWMMSEAGYRWMIGGSASPGWMTGGVLPGMMMGGGTDPGKVMGSLWANAPGPRVSPAQATALGDQVPAGAQISEAGNTITFTTSLVRLTILASPSGGPDETFRVAGLVNPRIIVPAGARVSIQLVNADPDTAHGLIVTASDPAGSWMPMMAARPAFTGSTLWFLGNPTSAGDARRHPHLHRHHPCHLPLPVPGPWPRSGRDGRHPHRQVTSAAVPTAADPMPALPRNVSVR